MAATEQDAGPKTRSKVVTDEDAARIYALLSGFAKRIPHEPGIKPPEGGMVRLGGRDRASYVYFIPCHPEMKWERTTEPRPENCNHGIGVDRQYRQCQVRAWAHGAPGVHDVTINTHEVTAEILETAAKLVGIPLKPPPYVGALDAECPVCLQPEVRHDGSQLETHKTPAGHVCHGSGWKITRSKG